MPMTQKKLDKIDRILELRGYAEKEYCRRTRDLSLEMEEDCIPHCVLAGTGCCPEVEAKLKFMHREMLSEIIAYRDTTIKLTDKIDSLMKKIMMFFPAQPQYIQDRIIDENIHVLTQMRDHLNDIFRIMSTKIKITGLL